MAAIEIEGYAFEYRDAGSGEPMVLVHGSASDYRTWQQHLRTFGEHYHVLAYSRRYHWPNEPISPGADYAMIEHVLDLAALIRNLELQPVHLVGHSYGGFVALLLAAREPSLVRRLVLAEPPAVTLFVSNPPRPSEVARLILTRPRTAAAIAELLFTGLLPARAAARKGRKDDAMHAFGKAVLGSEAFENLTESRMEQVRANQILAEYLGSGLPPLDDETVREVRCPTLLLTGDSSPAVFHRIAERLGQLLPECTSLEIPGASHIIHEDNPSAFAAAVTEFVAHEGPV